MILLAHTAIAGMAISEAAIRRAIEGDGRSDAIVVRIAPCERPIDAFDDDALWAELAAKQQELFTRELRPLLDDEPDRPLVYFGLAPIPLAVHLGSLIGQTPTVNARLRHHQTRTWVWPRPHETPDLVRAWQPLHPDPSYTDEVTLRVHTSYEIDIGNTRAAAPSAMHALDVRVHHPHPDSIASEADLEHVALSFKAALDHVANVLPRVSSTNLFASVPVGLALRLGTALNPTIHLPIQTWQYLGQREARFRRAILIGRRIERPRVLVLAAAPADRAPISAAPEVQEIADALSVRGRDLEVVTRLAATLHDFGGRLFSTNPSFVHFAGHGRRASARPEMTRDLVPPEPSAWVIHDYERPSESKLVAGPDVIGLLKDLPLLRLVVITACHGEALVDDLAAAGRVAIGFRGPLDDAVARTFAQTFWRSMVDGSSVAHAFQLACMAIGHPARELALLRPLGAGRDIYLVR